VCADLEQSIRAYIDTHNADPKPFVWHKPADTILASVARAAKLVNSLLKNCCGNHLLRCAPCASQLATSRRYSTSC
jgi:hypothetical protein